MDDCDVSKRGKRLEVRFEEIETRQDKTRQESKLFQSRNLLGYTRERVKREEKEILQHQTTSLYIQFVHHSRVIPHASMYQPNNPLMILHTRKLFLSVQPRHIVRRRNTSSHILISSLSFLINSTPFPVPHVPLEPSSALFPE